MRRLFNLLVRPTWSKGLVMLAIFLLFGIINLFTTRDLPFYMLAWPMYVIPQQSLAAIVDVLYIYVLASLIVVLANWRRLTSRGNAPGARKAAP